MIGLIFDFDGPIYDGRRAMHEALRETRRHFRPELPVDAPDFQEPPLYGPKRLIDTLFSQADLPAEGMDAIRVFYAARLVEIESRLAIADNMQGLIRALHAAGIPMAILSLRNAAEVKEHLKRAKLEACFKTIVGRDSLPVAKPDSAVIEYILGKFDLPASACAMVGDSDYDWLTASNAKVAYYHAAWTGEPTAIAYRKAAATLDQPQDYRLFLQCIETVEETNLAELPPELKASIVAREFCFFAGAGVSIPSGIGGWLDHYQPILSDLGATLLMPEHTLPEALQLVARDADTSSDVFNRFSNSFNGLKAAPNDYHLAMLRAHPNRIWTTNYDDLFEKAAEAIGSPHLVVRNDEKLLEEFGDRNLVIKMNGDFSQAEFRASLDWGMVFLEEQFDLAERSRREILRLFEDDYRNHSIIFVGISFRDPVLRRILAVAAKGIPKSRRPHYLLSKAPSHPLERYKFRLYRENLRRRNIETLFFADFGDMQRLVRQIAVAARRPVVGFCGTVKNPADPATPDEGPLKNGVLLSSEIEKFCATLGRHLARRGFRVTSGHGRGVGVESVNAAFEQDPTSARYYLRSRGSSAFSRTAPAVVVGGDKFEATRERFISELDLMIAIGGDTINETSSGTIAEIQLALSKHIPVLLVPQGGGDVAVFAPRFMAALDQAFGDLSQRSCVREANEKLWRLGKAQILPFAEQSCVDLIEDVVAKSLASSTRRERDAQGQTGIAAW